jgi:exoribonuclease II
LEELGVVRVVHENVSTDHTRKRTLAGANASVDALTEQDKAFLDEQLRRFREFTAAAIEDYSHEDLAWHITDQGAPMPYEMSGIRQPARPDEDTLARGRRIAKRIREEGRLISRIMVERDETL